MTSKHHHSTTSSTTSKRKKMLGQSLFAGKQEDMHAYSYFCVHTILDLNQTINLDITVNPRIIYSNNFTYFTTYKTNSIGA